MCSTQMERMFNTTRIPGIETGIQALDVTKRGNQTLDMLCQGVAMLIYPRPTLRGAQDLVSGLKGTIHPSICSKWFSNDPIHFFSFYPCNQLSLSFLFYPPLILRYCAAPDRQKALGCIP